MSQACLHMLALKDPGGASWSFYRSVICIWAELPAQSARHKLRAEHSTSVTQMNMQPTLLFKMQTEHGPDSSAEFETLQTAACSFHRMKSLERSCICS